MSNHVLFANSEDGKRSKINWLGRQDSNLGMAESKSEIYPNEINAIARYQRV